MRLDIPIILWGCALWTLLLPHGILSLQLITFCTSTCQWVGGDDPLPTNLWCIQFPTITYTSGYRCTFNGVPVHSHSYFNPFTFTLKSWPYDCPADKESNRGTKPVQVEEKVEKNILKVRIKSNSSCNYLNIIIGWKWEVYDTCIVMGIASYPVQ